MDVKGGAVFKINLEKAYDHVDYMLMIMWIRCSWIIYCFTLVLEIFGQDG